MTKQDLKKLSRSDLLELLLEQTKENERLQATLTEANRKLADREIMLDQAGSIAEATLKLNGVFEAAQQACDQYIENIHRLHARQERLCAQREAETKFRLEKLFRGVIEDEFGEAEPSELSYSGVHMPMGSRDDWENGEEG